LKANKSCQLVDKIEKYSDCPVMIDGAKNWIGKRIKVLVQYSFVEKEIFTINDVPT